jgi:hypothetical protein
MLISMRPDTPAGEPLISKGGHRHHIFTAEGGCVREILGFGL